MTLEKASEIAFRDPIRLGKYIIIDIYPTYVDGQHILKFEVPE